MQLASVNFTEAVTGAGRVRHDRLLVDWSVDGHGHNEVTDFFDRTITAGWGSARLVTGIGPGETITNQSWATHGLGGTVQASDFDVAPGAATHEVPEAGYRMTYLDGLDYADVEVEVNFSCLAPSGAGLEPANLLLRGTDTTTYLMARIFIGTTGVVVLTLTEIVGGVETVLDQTTVDRFTHDPNVPMIALIQWYGTELRMRIRPEDTAEHLDLWDVQATYLNAPVSGWAGVRSGVSTGNLNVKPVIFTYHSIRVTNGQYDDMSAQLGPWTVDHHLDDGLPDEVSFVSGTAVPTLRAEVIRPGHVPGRGRYTNRSFFSPYNADSPIYSFARDVPPATLEAGVVTEAGREYLPVFTGQAQDFTLNGNRVTLSAISAARLKLAQLITVPVVWGEIPGLDATWPVSFALATCGVYASPPPRDGTRYWAPMHGSLRSFSAPQNQIIVSVTPDGMFESFFDTSADALSAAPPPFIDGPFVAGSYGEVSVDRTLVAQVLRIRFDDGDDLFSQAGNRGRLEAWVRGDETSNDTPAGSATISNLVYFTGVGPGDTYSVRMGLATDRTVFVRVVDGAAHDVTLKSDDTLPTDGEWHFIGAGYDIAEQRLWVRNFDGTTKASTAATLVTSSLPATDTFDTFNGYPGFVSYLPIADVYVTAGEQANVDDFPTWLDAVEWTLGAEIVRSSVELLYLAEAGPHEAWDLISKFALAELAMLRIDETDVVRYLGWRHWGQAAQQVVVEGFDTARNMASVDANLDSTKIRNAVSVTYTEPTIDTITQVLFATNELYAIPPGVTTLDIRFVAIALQPAWEPVTLYDADDLSILTTLVWVPKPSYVTLNTSSNGNETYITTNASVEIDSWDAGGATLRFTNNTGITLYTANGENEASIQIAGYGATVQTAIAVERDNASIGVRGERGMTAALPMLQRSYDARRVARRLVNTLSKPVPTIERTSVRGHPGRQPGDLVTVIDSEVGIDNRFRIQSVFHDDDGELYSQQITARRARQGGQWGVDAYWGETIWTTED